MSQIPVPVRQNAPNIRPNAPVNPQNGQNGIYPVLPVPAPTTAEVSTQMSPSIDSKEVQATIELKDFNHGPIEGLESFHAQLFQHVYKTIRVPMKIDLWKLYLDLVWTVIILAVWLYVAAVTDRPKYYALGMLIMRFIEIALKDGKLKEMRISCYYVFGMGEIICSDCKAGEYLDFSVFKPVWELVAGKKTKIIFEKGSELEFVVKKE